MLEVSAEEPPREVGLCKLEYCMLIKHSREAVVNFWVVNRSLE